MTSSDNYDIMILSGGFDPIHIGHVRMFIAAKQMARIVIVGVNSDEWLTRKKGKPFMKLEERREVLGALWAVDNVWEFDDADDTANNLISRVHNLFALAGNRDQLKIAFGNGGDRTKENVPEQKVCEQLGIDMVWGVGGEDKPQSSSWLIDNQKK